MPRDPALKKVLVLGSGALKIGEAGEFDYSGSQAVKALREEGLTTIVMNPNIATIQTSPGLADRIYLLPVDPETVDQRHPAGASRRHLHLLRRPDRAQLRARALAVRRPRAGGRARSRHADRSRSRLAEDREKFAALLGSIGVPVPRSIAAARRSRTPSGRRGHRIPGDGAPRVRARRHGLGALRGPRPSSSGACRSALAHSPQVLVEEYLEGWHEVEYEIMRDARRQLHHDLQHGEPRSARDPHRREHRRRAEPDARQRRVPPAPDVAFQVFRALGLVGEGNIQFAIHPKTGEFRVIEVNPRLSRSSALASKATGYPIAYVATKLAAGTDSVRAEELGDGLDARLLRARRSTTSWSRSRAGTCRASRMRRARARQRHEVGRRGHGDRPKVRGGAAEGRSACSTSGCAASSRPLDVRRARGGTWQPDARSGSSRSRRRSPRA